MNKTKIGLGTLVLIIGTTAISAGSALAYRGNPAVAGPNYSADRHEAMLQAFEHKDYAAWKNLMQNRGRVTQVITETNFAKFAEAHKLALQGKAAEAQKIRAELGLGFGNGADMGMGRGFNR